MQDAVLVSLIIGGSGLALTIAGIVYSHGVLRGKQEAQQVSNDEFKAEVKAKLNGLPVRVAVLEQTAHDNHNRITKHHMELESRIDRLDDRMRNG